MIFYAKNAFRLQWTLLDATNTPLVGATVTATLYTGRSTVDPDNIPGTPVAPINNITLSYTGSSGIYSADVDDTLDPPYDVDQFTLVIDATLSGDAVYHQEERSQVIIAGFANEIDLVTLGQVKAWLGVKQDNTEQDQLIQFLITAFSQYVLNKTGIDSFNKIKTYTEIYDGNGQSRMFLRNRPILSIVSLNIGGFSPPVSTGAISPGLYVEQSGNSIAFRSSFGAWLVPTGIYPYWFSPGQGNIVITYTAGYAQVPWDLSEACMKAVKIYYIRKDIADVASRSLGTGSGTGTVSYRSWDLPPEINAVLDFYSRYARP